MIALGQNVTGFPIATLFTLLRYSYQRQWNNPVVLLMGHAMQFGPTTQESELIAHASNGDHYAFQELVRRYEATVAKTVFGMLGQCGEAEDVGQETMVRLYRSLPKFKGEASLKTYVTRIAMNVSIDALRRRKRKAWQFWRTDDGEEVEVADPRSDHADLEKKQSVEKALKGLNTDQRSVIVLRLIQGYSTEEVATMLDVPVGTVLSRLARGKKQLAEILKEQTNV